jgi:hypothetical protein
MGSYGQLVIVNVTVRVDAVMTPAAAVAVRV